MYMAKMSEMCRALYEKATATRLPVRLCDESQVNCDPDSGKVLLHTVLRPMAYTNDLENTFLARNTAFFLATIHKNATFYGQQPQKHHHIHEIARFYGQDDLRATNELPFQISRKWAYGFL